MQEGFFFYRLPDEGHNIRFGHSDKIISGIADSGYVIAPFMPDGQTILTIACNSRPLRSGELEKWLDSDLGNEGSFTDTESTTKEQHTYYIKRAKEWLSKLDSPGKIVISRILKTDSIARPSHAFRELCRNYPSAYIFAFYTPETGLWMGASPEMLLHGEDSSVRSVALAGTRVAHSGGEWDEKNREEQALVTRFIADTMRAHGLKPAMRGPMSAPAGPVEHLSTLIFSKTEPGFDFASLVGNLSPTPALSGYPRNEAIAMIEDIEAHRRDLYGGFSGYKESNDKFSFYVNIRIMRLLAGSTVLYAGGGITLKSDADAEWEETEFKLKTLLQLQ